MQRFFHGVRYLDIDSSELSRMSVACSKAGHICAPTHSTYAGANLILFCHPVCTDYHYPVLTSNRSVSETEIQRMFRTATVNWSCVCAQEICDTSQGGTWDTVYFICCKTQHTRTWKCLSYFFRGGRNKKKGGGEAYVSWHVNNSGWFMVWVKNWITTDTEYVKS